MQAKILHTSDWHLGKRLFKKERLSEQEQFLTWLHAYILKEKIDILIIAGDIFDVPTPPNRALTLYFEFLNLLSEIQDFEVVIISGNHDSKSLLSAPKHILKKLNCHIYTDFSENLKDLEHCTNIRGQEIVFKLLPYFRNYELINNIEKSNHTNAQEYFNFFFSNWNSKAKAIKILIAHHGFGKYSSAGSEQLITLSGLEYFPLEWVKEYFDYIALGHIHKRQTLCQTPPIIYPGSPIPLRFSESNQKFVSLIKVINEELKQEYIQIPVFTKLLQLKTNLNNYISDIESLIKNENDQKPSYLEMIIEMDAVQTGVVDSTRAILKDTDIELISYIPKFSYEDDSSEYQDVNQLNISELFEGYYKAKYQNKIPTQLLKSFNNLLTKAQDENS